MATARLTAIMFWAVVALLFLCVSIAIWVALRIRANEHDPNAKRTALLHLILGFLAVLSAFLAALYAHLTSRDMSASLTSIGSTIQSEGSLKLRYQEWRARIVTTDRGVTLEMQGVMRAQGFEFSNYRLTVTPLFIDTQTNDVDSPNVPDQPHHTFYASDLPSMKHNDGVFICEYTDLLGTLRKQYDGTKTGFKLFSPRYNVNSFHLLLEYWHFDGQDRITGEADLPSESWIAHLQKPNDAPFPGIFEFPTDRKVMR